MKSVFSLGASLAAAALLFAVVPACSSTKTDAGPSCSSAACAPGNSCLPLAGEVKCRKSCGSNSDPATSCPFGYSCLPPEAPLAEPAACTAFPATGVAQICGDASQAAYECPSPDTAIPAQCKRQASNLKYVCCPQAFCVKDAAVVTKGPGQWGTPCNAAKGLDTNPDCDSAQAFSCYGTGPADGAAYCTRYDCTTDRDCAGGYYCGTINVAPNVKTAKPTIHQTTTACIRRDYCAPCKADVDCSPLNGITQHCVPDDNYVGFCTPECVDSKNCNFEARCLDGGIGIKTCYPRAGTCVGDGSLCSPCRSDIDCGDDGVCVRGQYTTERSCAKKSGIACGKGQVAGTDFVCPAASSPKTTVACRGDAFEQVPVNYCHGLYKFGDSADIGCWTPAR